MFGTDKKIAAAVSATREEYRQKALSYFNVEVNNMNGSGALAWLRGGLELAEKAGILTAAEIAEIDSKGKANFEAKQKAQREAKERILEERKAKARAARGAQNNG